MPSIEGVGNVWLARSWPWSHRTQATEGTFQLHWAMAMFGGKGFTCAMLQLGRWLTKRRGDRKERWQQLGSSWPGLNQSWAIPAHSQKRLLTAELEEAICMFNLGNRQYLPCTLGWEQWLAPGSFIADSKHTPDAEGNVSILLVFPLTVPRFAKFSLPTPSLKKAKLFKWKWFKAMHHLRGNFHWVGVSGPSGFYFEMERPIDSQTATMRDPRISLVLSVPHNQSRDFHLGFLNPKLVL